MKKIIILFFTAVIVSLSIYNVQGQAISERLDEKIEYGTEAVRGFLFDNVLHSEGSGDIHFGLHIPESYDGGKPYALFVTLPGY